jgi:hypothetical protein
LGAGGGGAPGAGACAKADEATPTARTAARVVARQRQVIEISMKTARFRLGARRIG